MSGQMNNHRWEIVNQEGLVVMHEGLGEDGGERNSVMGLLLLIIVIQTCYMLNFIVMIKIKMKWRHGELSS